MSANLLIGPHLRQPACVCVYFFVDTHAQMRSHTRAYARKKANSRTHDRSSAALAKSLTLGFCCKPPPAVRVCVWNLVTRRLLCDQIQHTDAARIDRTARCRALLASSASDGFAHATEWRPICVLCIICTGDVDIVSQTPAIAIDISLHAIHWSILDFF